MMKIATSITFKNATNKNVNIFWINFKGQEQKYKCLLPGTDYSQPTFVDYNWKCRSDDG